MRVWIASAAVALGLLACAGPPAAPVAVTAEAPRLTAQIAANARALLATYDADGDGALAPAEGARIGLAGPAFAEADADGDGRVAAGELLAPARLATLEASFRAIAAQWAEVADADGDGRVSRAEYDGSMVVPQRGAAAAAALAALDPASAQRAARSTRLATAADAEMRAQAFGAADADQDGVLVPAEALGLVGWLLERGWRLAPRA